MVASTMAAWTKYLDGILFADNEVEKSLETIVLMGSVGGMELQEAEIAGACQVLGWP